jgi:hypothetical protein
MLHHPSQRGATVESEKFESSSNRLDDISTEWAIVRDPARFALRYAPAIRRYLAALIRNHHDADEVAQDFFLRVAKHGFIHTRQKGGRFRDYLKVAVRNAALNFLRRPQAAKLTEPHLLQVLIAKHQASADQEWCSQWRTCLLERACQALKRHEEQSPGNLFHTVLDMIVDNPLDDTNTLAARTSALIGRPLRAEAFRKQVSRARRMLAKLLVKEVAQTLDNPTAEQIKAELIELGLWEYIRDLLPASRRATLSPDTFTSCLR